MPTNFRCSILVAAASTDLQSPPSSQTSLILTDLGGSFSDTQFIAVPEARREILAVALAAISNKCAVGALVDPPTGVGLTPTCYELAIIVS